MEVGICEYQRIPSGGVRAPLQGYAGTGEEELSRATRMVSRMCLWTAVSGAAFSRRSSRLNARRAMVEREVPTLVSGKGKKNLDWMLSKPTIDQHKKLCCFV